MEEEMLDSDTLAWGVPESAAITYQQYFYDRYGHLGTKWPRNVIGVDRVGADSVFGVVQWVDANGVHFCVTKDDQTEIVFVAYGSMAGVVTG